MIDELIKILQDYIEADEITADSEFKHELGVSSFDTVCIIDDIKKKYGITLVPADFVRTKTVGGLAAYMESLK